MAVLDSQALDQLGSFRGRSGKFLAEPLRERGGERIDLADSRLAVARLAVAPLAVGRLPVAPPPVARLSPPWVGGCGHPWDQGTKELRTRVWGFCADYATTFPAFPPSTR